MANVTVADLLRREASVWETVSALASKITAPNAAQDESTHQGPHSRAYLSSLTQLAAVADALVAEALKLRQLRHARDTIEDALVKQVVADHQIELFKQGEATSRVVISDVLHATAQLRNEISRSRSEIASLKSALEALEGADIALPEHAEVVVGLRFGEGQLECIQTTSELIRLALAHSSEGNVTPRSLSAALKQEPPPERDADRFRRRKS